MYRRILLFLIILIFGAPLVSAQEGSLAFLNSPIKANLARHLFMRQAQREVLAVHFINRSGEFGLNMMAFYRGLAKKGKKVYLVLDDLGNFIEPHYLWVLEEAGVDIRIFNPTNWLFSPFQSARRNHDKIFVVDGEIAILGDRNHGEEYFTHDLPGMFSRDVALRGNVISSIRNYFFELFHHDISHTFRGERPSQSEIDRIKNDLDSREAILFSSPIENLFPGLGNWRPTWRNIEGTIRFVRDPIQFKGRIPGIEKDILELLDSARSEILVQTPYLVLTREFENAVKRAIDRGVRVVIMTNSSLSTDNGWTQGTYQREKKHLIKMGIELYEFYGPETLHIKNIVVDAKSLYIGSYNWDPRSQYHNIEDGVVVEDPAIARVLRSEINHDIHRYSFLVGSHRNPESRGNCRRFLLSFLTRIPFLRHQL